MKLQRERYRSLLLTTSIMTNSVHHKLYHTCILSDVLAIGQLGVGLHVSMFNNAHMSYST